jgi:hypothetical protein
MSVEIVWGLESLHKHVVDNQMVGDLRRRWWGVVGFPRLREKLMKDVVEVRKRRQASYSRDNAEGNIIESKVFMKNAGRGEGEKGRGGVSVSSGLWD